MQKGPLGLQALCFLEECYRPYLALLDLFRYPIFRISLPFPLRYPSDLRLPIFPSRCLKLGLVASYRWGIGGAFAVNDASP